MLVTIIGAGAMGRGIGTRMVAGGNDVEVVDHDPGDAAALAQEIGAAGEARATAGDRAALHGQVVVLAIGYGALAAAVQEYGDQLQERSSWIFRTRWTSRRSTGL
jgi:predicted dinucleotide-binding enzyme